MIEFEFNDVVAVDYGGGERRRRGARVVARRE